MSRKLAWISMALLLLAAIYGIAQGGLFSQRLWGGDGARRFRFFAGVFAVLAGLTIWRRPSWLGLVVGSISPDCAYVAHHTDLRPDCHDPSRPVR